VPWCTIKSAAHRALLLDYEGTLSFRKIQNSPSGRRMLNLLAVLGATANEVVISAAAAANLEEWLGNCGPWWEHGIGWAPECD